MQLLFEESDEGGSGLGLFAGRVRRVEARRVPHMGWNEITPKPSCSLFEGLNPGTDVYFVHSYHLVPAHKETISAVCEHGLTFAAAIEQDNIHLVQFHPEKSQANGLKVLENFLVS